LTSLVTISFSRRTLLHEGSQLDRYHNLPEEMEGNNEKT